MPRDYHHVSSTCRAREAEEARECTAPYELNLVSFKNDMADIDIEIFEQQAS